MCCSTVCSYYRWAWAQTAVDMTVFSAHEMRDKFSAGPQWDRLHQLYEKARDSLCRKSALPPVHRLLQIHTFGVRERDARRLCDHCGGQV